MNAAEAGEGRDAVAPMHDRQSPSPWVARFIAGVPAGGRVLDVACGGGRHLALGLERGLAMVGIDRGIAEARRRLAGRPGLELIEADLEDAGLQDGRPLPFGAGRFDGVIVTNYLWRPILPAIVAALAPGGLLIYETFAVGNARFGRPSSPAFLLRPAELVEAVRGQLTIVAYEHGRLADPDRIVQRIVAVGAAHPWAAEGAAAL